MSLDEILKCEHLNEIHGKVLQCWAAHYVVEVRFHIFESVAEIVKNVSSKTTERYFAFSSSVIKVLFFSPCKRVRTFNIVTN